MHYVKLAVKISLLLALICFILPFVSVSCEGSEVEYKGIELMTAREFGSSGSGFAQEEDYPPNLFLIASFVVGIVAAVLGFADKNGNKMAGIAVTSLISLIGLILFKVIFIPYYDLQEYEGYIRVNLKIGWILAFLFFLVAFGGAVTLLLYIKSCKDQYARETQMAAQQAARAPAALVCPRCGMETATESKYCSQCGASIRRDCPWCGAEILVSSVFCPNCGKDIKTGQSRGQ